MTPDDKDISKKDLIEELKDATELIEMVRGIQGGVAANPVLNGGDKKTEVKVESNVLEGDIVDRALESAQRKADSFKKLVVTIAPLFLLIGGGGSLEMFGVINIFDDTEIEGNLTYGCTDPEAWNYDELASEDDGSCEYDDHQEECDPIFYSYYAYWIDDEIEFEFDVDFNCDRSDEVEVVIEFFVCNNSAIEGSTNLVYVTNGTDGDLRYLHYPEADPDKCYDASWDLYYDGRYVDWKYTEDIRK